MKKFKVRRKNNFKIMILIIVIILLFIWFSFHKLHKSYNSFTSFILNNTIFDNKKVNIISKLTNNLDILFANYNFIKEDKNNNKINSIYIYNNQNDNTISKMFSENLKKLGINSYIEDKNNYYKLLNNDNFLYYVNIQDSSESNNISINNKSYATFKFLLNLKNPNYIESKPLLEEMEKYLNTNYPKICKGISDNKIIYNDDINENTIIIEIDSINNNYEAVNNSTEILSLMFYHMLGDKL